MSNERNVGEIIARLKMENEALRDRVKYTEGQLSGMRISEHIKHVSIAMQKGLSLTLKSGNQLEIPPEPAKKKQRVKHKFGEMDTSLANEIKTGVLNVSGNMMRKPNMGAWANEIRVMRSADHLKASEIQKVFRWANRDPFWKGVILSPFSLRRNWDKIVARMGTKSDTEDNNKSDSNITYIKDRMNGNE